MPDLVVDASVALAWGLPDEASDYAAAVLAVVEHSVVHIPDLWLYEIANGLAIASRRKRILPEEERVFLTALSKLNLNISRRVNLVLIRELITCARRFGLTAYDAAYVNLALQQDVPLATLDHRMRQAAVTSGVEIFSTI